MNNLLVTFCVLYIQSAVCDMNKDDKSGIGLIVSLFSPGHLSLIPGNPNNMNLSKMNERSSVSIKTFNFNTPRAKIVSLAADPRNKTLFILDSDSHSLYRMENFNIWINETIEIVPLHKGLSKTSAQIAYDWRSRNIYWVDGYYNWVAMQPAYSNDNSMYRVIIRNFTKRPEGLAIDPDRGYIFWSEMSSNPRIEKCNLVGEDRTAIISRGIGRIYDIAADVADQIIYWVDATRHTIEAADYYGRNRRILVRMNSIKFTSITVYGEHLYVASFTSNTVSKVNKRTGEVSMVILVDDGTPVATEIYDPTKTLPLSDVCDTAGCEHFCSEMPKGPRCVCKEGYRLLDDQKSCEREYYMNPGLLFGNATHVCHLDIRQITALKDEHRCFTNFTGLRWLVTDTERNMFYYVNTVNQTLMQYSLTTNSSDVLTNTNKNVTGLTYDWINKNIFWADADTGVINVYSVTNKAVTTLYTGRKKPVYVQANPRERMLYWIEGEKPNFNIIAASMDGKNTKTLVNTSVLHSPTGLYYEADADRLYWINWHSIKTVKPDGTDLKGYLNIMSILFFGVELMVYKDYAIWTHGRSFITASSIHKSSTTTKINMSDYSTLTAMAIYDPSLQKAERGPCDLTNGGCEHICLPMKNGERRCKCDFGFRLDKDMKSCVTDVIENNFLVAADYSHGRIYQVGLQDKLIKAIDLPEVDKPACVALHKPSNTIYWIEIRTGGSRIRKAYLNGTNATEIYSSALVYPDRMVIDFTTGYLYFTAVSAITMGSYVGVIRPDTGDHKQLVTGLFTPRAIILVPDEGFMFWTDHHKHNAHIGRAYMDGSQQQQIVSSDITWPNGLAIDYKKRRLYWADGSKDRIESVDYDGSNRKVVLRQKDSQLVDIVMSNSYIYFTAWNTQKIQKVRINADGSGTLVDWMDDVPEFGRLDSIDIYPRLQQPRNKNCSSWNGRCSTFCLPNAKGRACACSDADELLSRGQVCGSVSRCEQFFPGGDWEEACGGFPNQKCNYTCMAGYKRNPDLPQVHCSLDAEWELNGKLPCIADECPAVTHPVKTLINCTRKVDSVCKYACVDKFIQNVDVPVITCLSNQKWSHAMQEMCRPPNLSKICKDSILYGSVSLDCPRTAGSVCSFKCDPGYLKKDENVLVVCKEDGRWDHPVTELCTAGRGFVAAQQKEGSDSSSSTLYAGVGGAIAALVVILIVFIIIVVFVFLRKRRQNQVGRYQTQHNVYCEPDKGVVNIAADVPANNGTEHNNTYGYATMSET